MQRRNGRNVSTGHLGRACRPPASSGPGSRSHILYEYVSFIKKGLLVPYISEQYKHQAKRKINKLASNDLQPDWHRTPHSPHSLFDRRNPQRQLGPFFSLACQERSTYSRGFDFHVLDRHRHLELESADEDKHEGFHSARTRNEKDRPVSD